MNLYFHVNLMWHLYVCFCLLFSVKEKVDNNEGKQENQDKTDTEAGNENDTFENEGTEYWF